MNSAHAYEQHTDLVRALTQKSSAARRWFDDYHEQIGFNPVTGEKQPVIALADSAHLIAQMRAGRRDSHVSLIAEYTPGPPVAEPMDVGVVDPERLRAEFEGHVEPAEDTPDILGVPRPVLTDLAVDALAKAATVYVTADMVTVLEHAAAALDETDLMPFHPAYPHGFAVLARPLRLPYGDGTDQVVHAFGWVTLTEVRTAFGGAGRAGMVWQFVNRHDSGGDRAVRFAQQRHASNRSWRESPALVLNIADQFVTGATVGEPVETEGGSESARLMRALLNAMDAPEETVSVADRVIASEQPDAPVVGRFQPYLAALLLLLGQEITATRKESVNRHARKRAQRTGRLGETVTVIDLAPRRHSEGERETGEADRHYSVRHIVNGHWRWQPYGPERRLRRRIYVAGYVRGPEDAPLVVKPRVRRL